MSDGTRSEIERFFSTLLLGDFEEDQSTSAQIVGGLISLVPVLDQVMDVRDISGALFRISQRGGFAYAGSDQLVNLGFAAFGAIPEIGSVFKTVFKPLWKERRAAKGAVHSGLGAVERLLGMKKGGAIAWVREQLLGKWAARTNQAILLVEGALASCIELTEFIATADGWKDWLIPDSVQALARELLPSLKNLRGQIRAPLTRASDEIHAFLEDLLGEQAAAIVVGAGQRAATGSSVPGSRSRTGHNRADAHPRGNATPREPAHKVGTRDKSADGKGGGPAHSAVQRTRKAFSDLANQEKGLVGEHIVDYYELARLGGSWTHDNHKGSWAPERIRKLNVDKRPVNLSLADLPKVNHAGIDAVWQHEASYTATEAKARESIHAAYGLGKYLTKKGKIPAVTGLTPSRELLHYLLSDSGDKGGTVAPMMQMSVSWVRDRSERENLPAPALAALANAKNRRVVLVTFESTGAPNHVEALADIHLGKTGQDVRPHSEHFVTEEWEAADINAVEKARTKAHEVARKEKEKGSESETSASSPPPPKPTRASRSASRKK